MHSLHGLRVYDRRSYKPHDAATPETEEIGKRGEGRGVR
jgi:hypothetical protein